MTLSFFSWLFMSLLATIFFEINVDLVSAHCQSDQQGLLLQFKNRLNFNSSLSLKLVKWNQSLDCCMWEGVTCDVKGRVTDLDLSNEGIFYGIDNSSSLFNLQHLHSLNLAYNGFNSTFPSGFDKLAKLSNLNLSHAGFIGQIPLEISRMTSLVTLDLSVDDRGLELENPNLVILVQNLKELKYLFLDGINLSTQGKEWCQVLSSLPNLIVLGMSNCYLSGPIDSSLSKFQSKLYYLDLSNNQIEGEIPNWVWSISSLEHLNLSHNFLVNFQEPMPDAISVSFLDLHGNKLQGQIPKPLSSAVYIDYSSNNFSSIPIDIGNSLMGAMFFSLSNNNLHGIIPESICKPVSLFVLDLSNNSLSGTMPQCLTRMRLLSVLDLSTNNLSGNIPDTFSSECLTETLALNGNHLEGKIPRSLANCSFLELLDLGNNQINDTFPCHLNNISSLKVLVLRSNNFHGQICCPSDNFSWPLLQIIDLASNHFWGELPNQWLQTWEAMKNDSGSVELTILARSLAFVTINNYPGNNHGSIEAAIYYQDSVLITNKGTEISLAKIISLFTFIDFSCNKFEGQIPELLGEFKALYALNLSHNGFKGLIPTSLGNLKNLESLDLSRNNLSGEIPQQLGDLNFLAVLNLSHNHLEGRIPNGRQFQTFSEDSFKDNKGLCGLPLKENCSANVVPTSKDKHSIDGTNIDWNFLSVEFGFVFGLGIVILPLMFYKRWRLWYCKRINGFLSRFFPQLIQRSRNCGRIASRKTKTQSRNNQQ
ncbi:hypothetical protein SLA2020_287920 [Shorea laevis]